MSKFLSSKDYFKSSQDNMLEIYDSYYTFFSKFLALIVYINPHFNPFYLFCFDFFWTFGTQKMTIFKYDAN